MSTPSSMSKNIVPAFRVELHRNRSGLWFRMSNYDSTLEVTLKRPDARRILKELNSVGFSAIRDGSTIMSFCRPQGDIPFSISCVKKGKWGTLEAHLDATAEQRLIDWLGDSLANDAGMALFTREQRRDAFSEEASKFLS
jgi:hypothetical protein